MTPALAMVFLPRNLYVVLNTRLCRLQCCSQRAQLQVGGSSSPGTHYHMRAQEGVQVGGRRAHATAVKITHRLLPSLGSSTTRHAPTSRKPVVSFFLQQTRLDLADRPLYHLNQNNTKWQCRQYKGRGPSSHTCQLHKLKQHMLWDRVGRTTRECLVSSEAMIPVNCSPGPGSRSEQASNQRNP